MAEEKFREWIRSEGGEVHPGISLFHSFGGGRRGVVANEEISEGEELLVIPSKATLFWHTSEDPVGDPPQCRDDVKSALNEYTGHLSPFAVSVLILLGETKSNSSPYKTYIDMLPDDTCDCLMAWSSAELKRLKGTSIEAYSPSTMRNLYDESLMPFFQANQSLFGKEMPAYDKVLFAGCMVQSRAFHMQADNWVTRKAVEGAKLHMLPGIDMINHSCIQKERNSVLCRVNDSKKVKDSAGSEHTVQGFFKLKAERDIELGEEILHNYGDLGDAELLDIYGFIGSSDDVMNPHNGVTIPISYIMDSCKKMSEQEGWELGNLQTKIGVLSRFGSNEKQFNEAQCVISADKPLPDDLLTIAQVLLMPVSELEELIAEKGAGSSSKAENPNVSLGAMYLDASELSELVCLSLLKAVELCTQRYPESLSQAKALLKGKSLPHRETLAAQLRVSELKILNDTKEALIKLLVAVEQGNSEEADSDFEEVSSEEEPTGAKKKMKFSEG